MVQASERRRLSESDYQLLLDSISDYEVLMIDPSGIILTWNRGAQLLKGYKPDEIIGQSIAVFYEPQDINAGLPEREMQLALQQGRYEVDAWRLTKSRQRLWSNIVFTPMRDKNGEHIGFVKIARDLTERVARERQLQRARDEILELSTPVISVLDKVLALPIIGTLDSTRAARLTENLLQKISEHQAEIIILDVSGVPTIDSQVAQHLLKTVQAARLMGSRSIICGVRPETAQAMVHLGVELGDIHARGTLRDAMQLALHLRKSSGSSSNEELSL